MYILNTVYPHPILEHSNPLMESTIRILYGKLHFSVGYVSTSVGLETQKIGKERRVLCYFTLLGYLSLLSSVLSRVCSRERGPICRRAGKQDQKKKDY